MAASAAAIKSCLTQHAFSDAMTRFHTIERMIIPAVLVGCMTIAGCSPPKSSFIVTKATVIKVYSATDSSGHRFVSYVVDRGGVEIVVSDTLAKTEVAPGNWTTS
jgi:hypothetical protein